MLRNLTLFCNCLNSAGLGLITILLMGLLGFSPRTLAEPPPMDPEEVAQWMQISPINAPPSPFSAGSAASRDLSESLQQVARKQIDPVDFFQRIGREGRGVQDLVSFKADFINRRAQELAQLQGKRPLATMAEAVRDWQTQYGPAERRLMDARRQGVQRAYDAAVKRFIQTQPDFPYMVKMDVGSWAKENYRDLRFEGDIDFTNITSQVDKATILRDLYNAEVRRMFGLDMGQLQAHATAHRRPTSDVYLTQAGADWAEIDARKRGVLQEVTIENGEVVYRPVDDPLVKAFVFANLKNNLSMREGAPDRLQQLMAEPSPTLVRDLEPGISLELLRHLQTDAVKPNLAVTERLLKLAKFVERSVDISTGLAPDSALVAWATQVARIKENGGLTPSQKMKRILELPATSSVLGSPRDMAGVERGLQSLGERSSALIRQNAERTLDARIKRIDGLSTPQEQTAARRELLGDLEQIYRAYVEGGVDFPPKAQKAIQDLAAQLQRSGIKIPAAEMAKMKRMLDSMADQPGGLELALVAVWNKAATFYNTADEVVDAFNYLTDTLDRNTVSRLRALNTELKFGGTASGKFAFTVPLPIGKINDRLNATILARVGSSLPFKSYNLYQQGLAFYEAYASGKDAGESARNLATEMFRNWVPGSSVVEAYVMENYTRMAVAVVYLIFPTTAIPEALYGMSVSAAHWWVGRWQANMYEEMVDTLYSRTIFRPAGNSFEIVRIWYPGVGGREVSVPGSEAYRLPEMVPAISNILVPRVRSHPRVAALHELLEHAAISSGQSNLPVWPRRYRGLTAPGEKLYREYTETVTDVTREFFAEVTKELIRRHTVFSGAGAERVREIAEELGCEVGEDGFTPLWRPSGREAQDQAALVEIIDTYGQWQKVHKELLAQRERWQALFLPIRKPTCSLSSMKTTLAEDEAELTTVRRAAEEAILAVVEIIGQEAATERLCQPAVRARIGAMVAPSGSAERREWTRIYREILDALREGAQPLQVRIVGPARVEAGDPATFMAVLDREVREARYDWRWEEGGAGETLQPARQQPARLSWTPQNPGKKRLAVFVQHDIPHGEWSRAEAAVEVFSPEDAPRPVIRLLSPVKDLVEGERLPLQVEVVEAGLPGRDFDRYFWYVDGQQVTATAQPEWVFTGEGYGGSSVEVKVSARQGA